MELRRLRYFRVVAEEGHITRAAERLSMQQPPLSLQIKALETELGVRLFRRLPRGVALTEAGASFYADICVILDQVDQAAAKAQRVARGEAGSLALGFTGSVIAHNTVKSAIKTYRARFPDVALHLVENGSAQLVDAIAENRLDAAFVRSEAVGAAPIQLIKLVEEPIVLACPEGGALAVGADPATMEEIAAHPLVLYRRTAGPVLYDRIMAWFAHRGLSPEIIQDAPRVDMALNLVAAGMGASLVPQSLCSAHLDGVHYRDIAADPPLFASITLAARRAESSNAVRNFLRLARAPTKTEP